MNSKEIRQKFLDYFKKRNHTIVPSSSLIPSDPSVLLTSAGMQQFKDYFTGELNPEKDFNSLNVASVQKCFRTSDIEEVGDENHLTFFEMLGNFSFGGYFKEKAIEYAYDFIVNELGLEIDYVTVFDPKKVDGDDWRKNIPFDKDSFEIWKNKIGLPEEKIKTEGIDNFWGPTGMEGPCGPTTEIYVNGVEIWNLVFNEYYADKNKSLKKLKSPGVDTGLGFERLVLFIQNADSIFDTDLFTKPFNGLFNSNNVRSARITADHIRGSVFLLADGIFPSNKGTGYILRRLIRRLIIHARKIGVVRKDIEKYIENIIKYYGALYPELKKNKKTILGEFIAEADNFEETLEKGMKEFNKLYPKDRTAERISSKDAFNLYQSYGFPLEIVRELAKERGYNFDEKEFNKQFEEHKEISRAGAEKKFGGHGLILDAKITRLHTATHLLHKALRDVIGAETKQEGSDINPERTRFDFKSDRKLTNEELQRVEDVVNEKIKEDLPVSFKEMPKSEAEKTGALHFFKQKYPDKVKVYYIGDSIEKAYSKEFCGGPHVKHTGEIGKFKILKQESVGRDIKRIRATVE